MSNQTYQQRGNQNSRMPVSQRRMEGGRALEDNRAAFAAKQLKQGETAQRVEEEYELLKEKPGTAQRVKDDEEETAQAKFSGQAPPVQREEQPAKPNNTGLPDKLKNGIEALSGLSMDNVKVHYNSAKPQQLNALAYAQGTDIHVGSGQEQHLPHEAWHVVQQAQGRVKPTMQMKGGVPVNDDAGLEREADVMGGRAVQMRAVGDVAVQDLTPSLPPLFLAEKTINDSNALQLRLAIQTGGEDTRKEFKTSDEAYQETYANVGSEKTVDDVPMQNKLTLNKPAVKEQFGVWINASEYIGIRALKGQSPINKLYRSYVNLGHAVLGEVDSKENLRKETSLAQDTALNARINSNIDALMAKIKVLLDSEAVSDEKEKLTGRWANWHRGKYWPSYYQYGFWNVLNNPSGYGMYAKVAVIHDITDFYWDNRNAVVDVPQDKREMSAYGVDGKIYKYNMKDHPLDTVREHGTLKEDSPFIVSVRKHKMPMDVGPSFTTGRFMQLAETVNASVHEKEAIAWGLFAYWNQAYYTSASGMHRFHFVMDMASNYGVPYNTFHYPAASPQQLVGAELV